MEKERSIWSNKSWWEKEENSLNGMMNQVQKINKMKKNMKLAILFSIETITSIQKPHWKRGPSLKYVSIVEKNHKTAFVLTRCKASQN